MIGYEITARCQKLNYARTYSGWFEGDPKLESKAKEVAAKAVVKQVAKQGVKLLVSASAGSVVTVADIVSKPLQGLGSAAGQLIADNILKINRILAAEGLLFNDMAVSLTGDFEGGYRINTDEDLKKLPYLLALIPEKGTTDSFMGESVLEMTMMSHINFARYLRQFHLKIGSKQTLYHLEVNIDV
ncbi:hypothetical protein Pan97_09170 [Bremerella volcania]|uniref:Uncharacterized protein n=1 Tax=Bremerella volcania TaxID=2527984 RepID=A0A518C3W9_9BACT|nr:hypothetical protein [Bremerella volcania]QDU73917.1 hypothetical protein Pan97_09170 [Bremerella volcania]